jgi:hypothetical protein
MAIQQLKNTFCTKRSAIGKLFRSPAWNCKCDYCANESTKVGEDPGQAADNARKEGYKPIAIGRGMPMNWKCIRCLLKNGKVQ